MKTWRVRYAPPARDDLRTILTYISQRAGVSVASGFVSRLQRACDDLSTAPFRGTARDDLRPGLRTVGVERRATILFYVQDGETRKSVLGRLSRRAGQVLTGTWAAYADRRTRWFSLAAYQKLNARQTAEWADCDF